MIGVYQRARGNKPIIFLQPHQRKLSESEREGSETIETFIVSLPHKTWHVWRQGQCQIAERESV
jgi:hypothetical protein